MDEAVPGNSTNSPFEGLQAPNAVVIEATEASKQRYRGLTAGPLMNDTWTSTLALPLVQASQVTLQLQRPRVGLVLLIYQRLRVPLPLRRVHACALGQSGTRGRRYELACEGRR